MEYNSEYCSIFCESRAQLFNQIQQAYELLCHAKGINHRTTFAYISMIADELTAYNELSPVNMFFHLRMFHS